MLQFDEPVRSRSAARACWPASNPYRETRSPSRPAVQWNCPPVSCASVHCATARAHGSRSPAAWTYHWCSEAAAPTCAAASGDSAGARCWPAMKCAWATRARSPATTRACPGGGSIPTPTNRRMPIRYVPSPHPAGYAWMAAAWRISNRSDRQGARLQGAAIEGTREEQISAPVAPGTVQLPPAASRSCCSPTRRPWAAIHDWGMSSQPTCRGSRNCARETSVRFQSCDMQTATRLACALHARVARIALMIDQQITRGNIG